MIVRHIHLCPRGWKLYDRHRWAALDRHRAACASCWTRTPINHLDREVYEFVRHYTALHRCPPESVAGIARGLGVQNGSVYHSVGKLIALGALEREPRPGAPVLLAGPLEPCNDLEVSSNVE